MVQETAREVKILIVEDVDSMRQLLAHVLEGIPGFSVSGLARNGAEARHELSRRFPDLILLDEVLPGESGLDLLAEFYKLQLPVVLLTSLSGRTEVLPPGAFSRILKPSWNHLDQDRGRIETLLKQAWASRAKSTIDGSGLG